MLAALSRGLEKRRLRKEQVGHWDLGRTAKVASFRLTAMAVKQSVSPYVGGCQN